MNVKESLLRILAEAGGEFTSGTAAASALGVSRNAVWKAVKALEAEGYSIESVKSRGYRIAENSNRLSAELISARLETVRLGRSLEVLDETDSTNNYAKKLASAGAVHGTTVVADRQTAGKGRLGRSFISPPGKGLYVSIVVRPEFGLDAAAMITAAAACAAAEAVEELCGQSVRIKWVNDLYMNGKKLCGILTEASLGLEMKSLDYAVIGIGINVGKIGKDFGEELSRTVTSIEDETGKLISRSALCAELLGRLELYLGKVVTREFLPEYRRRELLTGHEVTASVGGITLTGRAIGIDDNANLMILLPDGSERHLSSGEANLLRIKR
ncbi:MAG: biotin--[acetyl-CoA-carboxylase] ligase [Ruminococcus sp.]|nr:biotin--[acetyl-CoA-carboxylase] ligase [Ruminococcus sp.]